MFSNGQLSRRQFLSVAAVNAVALATAMDGGGAIGEGTEGRELWQLSAADAVAAMKRGEITAERYASALLARCKAAESLNAFITLAPEQVLAAARAADERRRS